MLPPEREEGAKATNNNNNPKEKNKNKTEMLSPAFNVIAASLARNEVSRDMDIAEMANSATSLDLISPDNENTTIVATAATAVGSGSHQRKAVPSPAIQALLKRYGAEVRLPHLEKGSSIHNDKETSRRQLRLKMVVHNFIRKESLRRAEELQLVTEALQPAIHTAMTMRLSPASHYLLSFSSTREITDESVSCALNLSPEDLSAVADMFVGSSGGGAAAMTGGDKGANTATLSSLIPRQFFDPSAPHNSLFSLILSRKKAIANAEKEKVVAKSSVENNDNDTAKQSEKGKRKDASAAAAAPAPLPSILDTFTDILERLLSEEGREGDEDDDEDGDFGRGDGNEASSASSSASLISSRSSSSSSRFSNNSSSSSCSRERKLAKKRVKDSTRRRKGRATEGNANKKDAIKLSEGNRTRGRSRGIGSSSNRKRVWRRAAAGGGGSKDGGMRALLETCRRKWTALFLVWGRWSTAMALAAAGGASSTSSNTTTSSSAAGGGGSGVISNVNLVELILKLLTSLTYPNFDSALQALVDVFESEEAATPTSDNQQVFTPSPPPPISSVSKQKPAYVSLTETILGDKDRALLLRKVVIMQSLTRGLYARRVLFPRRFDALFGSGAFTAQYTCDGCADGTASALALFGFQQSTSNTGGGSRSDRSLPHSSVLSLQKQAKYLRSQRHKNTFTTLLAAYSGQQETLLHYVDTARELMNAEAKAEDFYANEEESFNRQFKQWSAKMTKYFLEEVPLDVDWVVQKTPLPPITPAEEAEDARRNNNSSNKKDGGEFIDPETGLRYQRTFLNVKTGKVQTENPNMLKAIATKNRQLVKAQRERELRIAEMNAFVRDRINGVKSEVIPAFEKQLAAPIFL